jgi:hypothetical protein
MDDLVQVFVHVRRRNEDKLGPQKKEQVSA